MQEVAHGLVSAPGNSVHGLLGNFCPYFGDTKQTIAADRVIQAM